MGLQFHFDLAELRQQRFGRAAVSGEALEAALDPVLFSPTVDVHEADAEGETFLDVIPGEKIEAREPGANIEPVGPEYSLTAMARYLNDRAASIYGGSNEIQRNIIAWQVLGL